MGLAGFGDESSPGQLKRGTSPYPTYKQPPVGLQATLLLRPPRLHSMDFGFVTLLLHGGVALPL